LRSINSVECNSGLLYTEKHTYVFRTDTSNDFKILAWNIHDDYSRGMTYKWKKFPRKSIVEYFDIDNPPQTVTYLPIIN